MNARLAQVARSGIKVTAAAADLLAQPEPGITILIYHRVGAGAGGQMDLDPQTFEEQVGWLMHTQRVISLDQAEAELRDGGTLRPGVVITFDDGTTDWVDHVLPTLERHKAPATFYVATDFVDRQVEFPGGGRPLSWAGLRELATSPVVTIGSHTHRHLLLDRLQAHEVDAELDRSIDLLRDRLEVDPSHFAYPKAIAGSPAAEAAVRERFSTAVLAGTRANPAGSDLHRLHRSPVQPADGSRWFRRKVVGGMHVEDDVRRLANRVRYRHASS